MNEDLLDKHFDQVHRQLSGHFPSEIVKFVPMRKAAL